MPNLVAQDMAEWMRRMESRMADLTRRLDPIRSEYFDYPGGYQTGWVDITDIGTGFSAQGGGNTPQVMRQGRIVVVRGRLTDDAGTTGSRTFATLPSGLGLEPVGLFEMKYPLISGVSSGATTPRYYVTTTGDLNTQSWQGASAVGLSGIYGVTGP